MANIDAKTVMELRKMTGAPMMDCKAALIEANADMEAAADVLRKKGLKTAEGKAGREAAEGRVFSYVHHNGRIGDGPPIDPGERTPKEINLIVQDWIETKMKEISVFY